MDERRPLKNHDTPEARRERDSRLRAEARKWVRETVQELFSTYPDQSFTVAEVLAELDVHPKAPAAWMYFLDGIFYQVRYGLVRNACEVLTNRGLLETGTTINAKGRSDVVCYRQAPPTNWAVEVSGDAANVADITESALRWAKSNPRLLRGAKSILVKRSQGTGNTTHDSSTPPREQDHEERSRESAGGRTKKSD